MAALSAGLGVARSARGLFEQELTRRHVVEILADFAPDPLPIHPADGRQYVAIATSGQRDVKGPQGSAYVVFALRK